MKRFLSCVLAALMLCGVRAGCRETNEAGNVSSSGEELLSQDENQGKADPWTSEGITQTLVLSDVEQQEGMDCKLGEGSVITQDLKNYYIFDIFSKDNTETPVGNIAFTDDDKTVVMECELIQFVAGVKYIKALLTSMGVGEENAQAAVDDVCMHVFLDGIRSLDVDNVRITAFSRIDDQTYKTYQNVILQSRDVISDYTEGKIYISEDKEENIESQESKPTEYAFTAGNYFVGEDIPAGCYDAVWVSGRGNCFAGGMIETFGEGEHAIREYKNVELETDDEVSISGTLTIKFVSE